MKKYKCVLGVLKTEEGLRIKDEMLEWLTPDYDVAIAEQEAPGVLFEYPFVKKACEVSMLYDEPVLYLHTKGAANPNPLQAVVRRLWQYAFIKEKEIYFNTVAIPKPVVSTLIASFEQKICWFNGFVMNSAAAKNISAVLKPTEKRFWFEHGMLIDAKVGIAARLICDKRENVWPTLVNYINAKKLSSG